LTFKAAGAMSSSSSSGSTKLYVGNLPESAREKDLRDLFQSFGEVNEVAVLGGYGFIVSFRPFSS
jgi:RNA-binding protein 4